MNLYHLAYQEKTLLSLIRLRSISPDKELLRKIMLAIWFCALVASVLFRRLVALAPYPLSPRGEIVEHARDVRMCIMWRIREKEREREREREAKLSKTHY